MSLARNAVITTVVTALLIGSLVFLFPSAGAENTASVSLEQSGISSVACSGTSCGTQKAVLKADFQVGASKLNAGRTALATAPTVTIADITDAGGAFSCASPTLTTTKTTVRTIESAQSTGSYGIQVEGSTNYEDFMGAYTTMEITGCTFFSADEPQSRTFTFTLSHGSLTKVQTKTITNPLWVLKQESTYVAQPLETQPAEDPTPVAEKTYTISSGSTTPGAPVAAKGETLPATTTASAKVTPKLKGTASNPATVRSGTEIVVEEAASKAGSLGAPNFGIKPSALASKTTKDPISFIRILANDPVDGSVNPGTVLAEMDAQVCTLKSKLSASGITNTDQIELAAFDDAGELKTIQPTFKPLSVEYAAVGTTPAYGPGGHVALSPITDDPKVCLTFTITHFSSFAILAAAAPAPSGGGGGGGGSTNTDFDFDGLPNAWEQQYCGSVYTCNPGDDLDGDGLTNLEEFALGTDPTNADTDGDGFSDGDEVANGTNPLVVDAPVVEPPVEPITDTNETTEPTTEEDGGNQKKTPGFEAIALIAALGAAFVAFRRK